MSLLNKLKKELKIDGYIGEEIKKQYVIRDWIDTGNYMLNAIISGDPFKGIPTGRIIQFAGRYSTYKSYFAIEIAKNAQKQGYEVIYYDSESAQDAETMEKRGLDLSKLMLVPVDTVEKLREDLTKIVNSIGKNDKLFIVIDSLGNLSTEKETEDVLKGKDKEDMTRAKRLKSLFRLVTPKIGNKLVSILLINHVYDSQNMFGGSVVSGGSGGLYNASVILEITKSQEKESNGNIVGFSANIKVYKSRFVREKQKVRITITFAKGLTRYSGLLNEMVESKLLQKQGRKFLYKGQEIKKTDLKNEKFLDKVLKEDLYDYIVKKLGFGEDIIDLTDEIEEEMNENEKEGINEEMNE